MTDNVPVSIQILDKEYRIACPEGEEEALRDSARLLHTRMREVRDSGKVIGADRIAVMAALNLTHELLHQRNIQQQSQQGHAERLKNLQERIDTALQEDDSPSLEL